MNVTTAIRNMIRERKIHQILSVMQSSTATGMQTLDEHLLQLMKEGKITRVSALKYCIEQGRFLTRAGAENHNKGRLESVPRPA